MKRIFNLFVLAALVASFALAALVSTAEARGRKGPSSEDLLFRGIDLYEDGQMDEAMENFMEVIRMGAGSEETALAKEYINRISYRMAGKPIENKSGEIKQSSETAPAFDASPEPALSGLETSAEAQKSQVSLEVPAQGPAGVVPFENQKPKPVLPAPQALQEYVKLKLLAKRQGLIEELGKKKALSLVLKGTDKLLAVAVAEEALFSKETGFRSDIGGMLEALSKAVYYHPNHLIRIYPGHTKGRSEVINLQRATVIGGYLSGRGLAPPRIEVDLEGVPRFSFGRESYVPKALEQMSKSREKRILLTFEEFANPFHRHYFFTKYLPRQSSKAEYPQLHLGVSSDKIDATKSDGVVIEFFAHSARRDIARWNLKLLAPDKSEVLNYEGTGSALETFYFEGKRDALGEFEMLPSGKYSLEAEALDIGGGKVSAIKLLEIIGKEPPKIKAAEAASAKGGSASGGKAAKAKAKVKTGVPAAKAAAKHKPKARAVKAGKVNKVNKAKTAAAAAAGAGAAAATGRNSVPEALRSGAAAGKTENVAPSKEAPKSAALTNFKIVFFADESSINKDQLSLLGQIAQVAKLYPSQRLSLIGMASPEEKNPEILAEDRVKEVAKILTADYGVAGSRLNIESGLGESGQRHVEVFVEQ